MNQAEKNYHTLHEISKSIRTLQGVSALLDWDQKTYMPPKAANFRADQLKAMAGIIHREQVSKQFEHALNQLIDIVSGNIIAKNLSEEQQAALKEWRRDYKRVAALPTEFIEELTKLKSQAVTVWQTAKKENDFQKFAPGD